MSKKSKKNKRRFGKLFGRSKQASEQTAQAEARKNDVSQLKYRLSRIDHDMRCIELGIVEVTVLDVTANGIFPSMKIVPIQKVEQVPKLEELRKMREDLIKMSGGILEKPSGLVGVDGAPVKSEVIPEGQCDHAPARKILAENPSYESTNCEKCLTVRTRLELEGQGTCEAEKEEV